MRHILDSHHQNKKNTILTIVIIIVAIVCSIASLFVGKYPLTWEKLMSGDTMSLRVFYNLRLPRTIMAVVGGIGIGMAGYVFQTVFRNPLAAPDIMGVSSGASAGAAFSIIFVSAASGVVTIFAFAGGMAAVILTLCLASLVPGKKSISVVLSGVVIHSLAQTVLMILKLLADPQKQLSSIEYWIMGSLNSVTLKRMNSVIYICLAGVVVMFLLFRQIQILSVEDYEARMLGVSVTAMRATVLLVATLVISSIMSVTGIIGFVGLIAPHTARLITGKNDRRTFLLSGVAGWLILGIADIFARSFAATELPVSVFTSIIGAPFLVYLMVRGRGNE